MSQERDMGHPSVRVWRVVGYAWWVIVRVLYFGVLREFAGAAEEPVEVQAGASVGELVRVLAGRSSKTSEMLGSIAVAVNREYAGADVVLEDGDEVALLPPVSGGCGAD